MCYPGFQGYSKNILLFSNKIGLGTKLYSLLQQDFKRKLNHCHANEKELVILELK
jgi:hypothetical protein